jgi:hypothetical protein
LALQKNARLEGSRVRPTTIPLPSRLKSCAGIVDRENDDGAGMADDIAASSNSPGLLNLVGGDVEDGSFICDAGREDPRLP